MELTLINKWGKNFDYLIADPYQEQVIPEGLVLETIPEL